MVYVYLDAKMTFLAWCERHHIEKLHQILLDLGYDSEESLCETIDSKAELHRIFHDAIPLPGHRAKLWLALTRSKGNSTVNKTTDEPQSSSEKWKNKLYGYVPYARHEDTKFFNSVLQKLYNMVHDKIPYPESFRNKFNVEKIRLWKLEKDLTRAQRSVKFVESDNPAACGVLLGGGKLVPHSTVVITQNAERLKSVIVKLEEMEQCILQDEARIHDSRGKFKCNHYSFNHHVNNEYLNRCRVELERGKELTKKLSDLLQKSREIFGCSFSRMKTSARSKKENKRKARQRKMQTLKRHVETLYNKIIMVEFHPFDIGIPAPATMVLIGNVSSLNASEAKLLVHMYNLKYIDEHSFKLIFDNLPSDTKQTIDLSELDSQSDSSDQSGSKDALGVSKPEVDTQSDSSELSGTTDEVYFCEVESPSDSSE